MQNAARRINNAGDCSARHAHGPPRYTTEPTLSCVSMLLAGISWLCAALWQACARRHCMAGAEEATRESAASSASAHAASEGTGRREEGGTRASADEEWYAASSFRHAGAAVQQRLPLVSRLGARSGSSRAGQSYHHPVEVREAESTARCSTY